MATYLCYERDMGRQLMGDVQSHAARTTKICRWSMVPLTTCVAQHLGFAMQSAPPRLAPQTHLRPAQQPMSPASPPTSLIPRIRAPSAAGAAALQCSASPPAPQQRLAPCGEHRPGRGIRWESLWGAECLGDRRFAIAITATANKAGWSGGAQP